MTLPDKADIATYGGALRNYGPVADPTTDQDADAFNEMKVDVGGMTNVVTRALVSFLGHATAPSDPLSGFIHTAVWGEAAPVKPVVTKVGGAGTGRYDLTWPEEVTDDLASERTVNLRGAKGWATGATPYHVQCEITAANVVHVRVFDMAGSAADAAGVTLFVEAF